jgi:hypothetical protein
MDFDLHAFVEHAEECTDNTVRDHLERLVEWRSVSLIPFRNFMRMVFLILHRGFSKGPPTADAIATVQLVQMCFNSTSLSEIQFISSCNVAENVAQCLI